MAAAVVATPGARLDLTQIVEVVIAGAFSLHLLSALFGMYGYQEVVFRKPLLSAVTVLGPLRHARQFSSRRSPAFAGESTAGPQREP